MTFQQASVKKPAISMARARDMSMGPVSPAILGGWRVEDSGCVTCEEDS
jgi:hypothetical protein